MKDNLLKTYLGPNSYPCIVDEICDYLSKAKAETLTGNEVLNNINVKLMESSTPMMDIKEFTTNAEAIASNDMKMSEIIEWVNKREKSGDLNYFVNLCKEEHFKNLTRTGFPTPEATIRDIEEHFKEPQSVVEALIKKGIFDKLESNLMMEFKANIDPSKNKMVDDVQIEYEDQSNVNNEKLYESLANNVKVYNPVGFKFTDMKNNRVVFLVESAVYQMNSMNGELEPINGNFEITVGHKRLNEAINNLAYNPNTGVFSLNENWDFDMSFANGEITMSRNGRSTTVQKEHLPGLLLESIQFYESTVPMFNKFAFTQDADNFVMLVENASKLINFDNVQVMRNMDNNNFALVSKGTKKPVVIASNCGVKPMFESFTDLVENVNSALNTNVVQLFESQLMREQQMIEERYVKINTLEEKKNNLNKLYEDNQNLSRSAEVGSLAYEKLNENSSTIQKEMDDTLASLNELKNNFRLYS